MSESISPIQAPVELSSCVIVTLSDGSAYLTKRDGGERVCKAYSFEDADANWRSKTTFFAKTGEDGFWCAYDSRKVTKTLD